MPDSGKTTQAKKIQKELGCEIVNGDAVRHEFNDWDFSKAGRRRQCLRIKAIAEKIQGTVIADFICPTNELRELFSADYVVWMDTIKKGKYENTNALFEPPEHFNERITEWKK